MEKAGLVRPAFSEFGSGPTGGPETMTTSNLNVAHSSDGVSSQLNLPTGPVGLVRPRRERSDEDRDFLADAFKVTAGGVSAKAVYRCLAYYASLTARRIAYPSQNTIAAYCELSVRQVRRVLLKLERGGLIVCLERKRGRCSSTYSIPQPGHGVPFNPDMVSDEEGRKDQETKTLSLSAGVQSQDHVPMEKKGKAVNLSLFPSPSRSEEKSAPARDITFPKQVALYCKLRRKLGREVNHTMETEFDRLPHPEKKRVIDDLEAQERELAHQGRVSAPPIKKPKGFLTAAAQEAQRIAACQHVPAEDLPINCGKCGAYIGKE